MFRTLKAIFGPRRDPAQLSLELDTVPVDADTLLARLKLLGLSRITRCRLTRNRNVMVSYRGRELRVHQGYLAAPREVHQAIVTFVEGPTRNDRRAARERIVAFGIEAPREPVARRERVRPEDAPTIEKLTEWHARLNAQHFDGSLSGVPVRVSHRMKTRLGHYSAAVRGEPGEIAISWRHLRRHGWEEALHTLLHEMVHQWQDENGKEIDHGRAFRAKAREVGIEPAAKRATTRRRGI
jgi:hypothetical protein